MNALTTQTRNRVAAAVIAVLIGATLLSSPAAAASINDNIDSVVWFIGGIIVDAASTVLILWVILDAIKYLTGRGGSEVVEDIILKTVGVGILQVGIPILKSLQEGLNSAVSGTIIIDPVVVEGVSTTMTALPV